MSVRAERQRVFLAKRGTHPVVYLGLNARGGRRVGKAHRQATIARESRRD